SYFGENQLSPGSIGFSPLPTPHPRTFQRTWVRASSERYLTFTLDMGRSPGFGSATMYSIRPLQTRFRCGSAFRLTSHTIATRRFILLKARRHATTALRLLVGTRFQVLFHSPPGVLFTFPSRYWFTIGH